MNPTFHIEVCPNGFVLTVQDNNGLSRTVFTSDAKLNKAVRALVTQYSNVSTKKDTE